MPNTSLTSVLWVMYKLSIFFIVPRAFPFGALASQSTLLYSTRVSRRQRAAPAAMHLHLAYYAAWLETRSRTRSMRRDKLLFVRRDAIKRARDRRRTRVIEVSGCAKNLICQTTSYVIPYWNYSYIFFFVFIIRNVNPSQGIITH